MNRIFKLIFLGFVLLVLPQTSLANEAALLDAYNLRFTNSELALKKIKNVQAVATNSNNNLLLFQSNCFLSLVYLRIKNTPEASKSIQQAAALQPSIKNNAALGYFYYTLYVYKNYIDEVGYEVDITKALTYFENAKNYKFAAFSAVVLANLNDKIPLQFLNKGLHYAQLSNDVDAILEANNCLATYKKEQFLDRNPIVSSDDVIQAYKKAIESATTKCSNKLNVASSYLNYANFLTIQNIEAAQTFALIDTALAIAKRYTIFSIIRNCYGVKGLFYQIKQQPNLAEQCFIEGIDYLNKMPFKDYDTEQKFYQNLKEIAAQKNDFKAYHDYDVLFQKATELAKSAEKERAIQNAIAKYDLKAKEEKIALLSKKNQFKDGLIITSLIALFLGIGMFFYFYKSTKIKHKYLEQKKKKLQIEKEQTQKELINSVLHLEKKNEILSELKQLLLLQNKEQHASINNSIFKTIDAGLLVDDDFEKFKNNFNTIYPEFFNRLQLKANHSLTKLDLKYCAFILMKVTNKEMAQQMNVEPKSIRMARYRIKQKFQLAKEEDLDEFIQNQQN